MSSRRPGRRAFAGALAALLSVLACGLLAAPAGAHTPHDDVSDVVFSPNFRTDGKVYAVVASRLMVSESGGYHWKPLVRGLPRAPEDGKSLARIGIAASDPTRMYLTSRDGGMFRSDDGGQSWHQAATGLANPDLFPVAVSPEDPDLVLAGGTITGFFRSADGGAHWSTVPGVLRVPAMTFVPATARALVGDNSGKIRASDDGGVTWRVVSNGLGASASAIAASAGATPTVFTGDSQGRIQRSDDGGSTFTAVGRGLPKDLVASIALSPDYASDHTAWASMSQTGVFRTRDGGTTWTKTSRGLTGDHQAHVVKTTEYRSIAAGASASGTVLYEAGFDGLFRSTDEGRTWTQSQTLVDFVTGLDVSPDYARDHTVAAAAYVKGPWLSTNRGDTWRPVDRGLQQEIGAGNKYAAIRRLHNITFSPDYATDRTIFSAGWTAFLKTTDAGGHWTPIQVGPPPAQPLLRQYLLGVAPDYSKAHTLYLGTRQGDVFRSTRAGDAGSWTRVGSTGKDNRVRSFAFDPTSATGTIFAGTVSGVMRSDDEGRTWTRTGPSGETLVAISPAYGTDHTVFAGTPDGLSVSRDGGTTWQPVPLPAAGKVEALALSPAYGKDGTVLLSVTGSGLYRSTDDGATFTAAGKDLLAGNHVIADFTNPSGSPIQFSPAYARDHTVFAYASQDVLRSTDRGDTWTVLRIPSAESWLRGYHPDLTLGTPAKASGSGHIGKRRIAAGIAGVALLVGAAVLIVVLVRRRRRRTTPEPGPTPAPARGSPDAD